MTKIFTITVLLLASVALLAKEIITKGYYITNQKDTIPCQFVLDKNNFEIDIQYKVVILDSANNKKEFEPGEIYGFCINNRNSRRFYCSLKNDLNLYIGLFKIVKPFIFLEQRIHGSLSWYVHSHTTKEGDILTDDILIKEEDKAIFYDKYELRSSYFKDLINYFSDYNTLSIMIKNNVLKTNDWAEILDYYNSWKAGSPELDKDTTIYQFVDKPAEFDYFSGNNSFEHIKSYFNKKVNFPNSGMKVYFQAIVEKTGNLSNIKILRPVNNEKLKKDLLDVAASMESWVPARQNGKIVRSSITFVVISEE